jgi:L-alanine-DL-glutamate epimerase-like enolase superfamily enzyme
VRITRVEPIVLRLPEIELRADGTQDAFLVRIETDEDLYGIGEGDTAPVAARAVVEMPASHSIAQGLGELLIGRDPLDIEPIWHELYAKSNHYGHRGVALHAISAIDIALHDLAGRALGLPVHKLLGGSFRDRVRVYASALMPATPDEVRRHVTTQVENGHRALKLGWGPLGFDARRDVALVAAAREAAGPDVDVMIDIGRRWQFKHALEMSRRFAEHDLYWLEEPLAVEDIDGYRRLCEASPLKIAAAEHEATIWSFRDWMVRGGLDIVQPDLARCGGFSQGRRIAQAAFELGRECVPHAFSTGILIAASLQLVASMPGGTYCEYTVAESHDALDVLASGFTFADGFAQVPAGPGLGIEIDEQKLARHRVG